MRGNNLNRAASRFECGLERIGQAQSVIVVGIGDGHGIDPTLGHDIGQNLSLTGIRGRGAEEEVVILDRGQRG